MAGAGVLVACLGARLEREGGAALPLPGRRHDAADVDAGVVLPDFLGWRRRRSP